MLGLVAGSPAIFGTWIGGFSFSPFTAIIFLSIGAGAIFQVILSLINYIRNESEIPFLNIYMISGISLGIVVMYITSIFI